MARVANLHLFLTCVLYICKRWKFVLYCEWPFVDSFISFQPVFVYLTHSLVDKKSSLAFSYNASQFCASNL